MDDVDFGDDVIVCFASSICDSVVLCWCYKQFVCILAQLYILLLFFLCLLCDLFAFVLCFVGDDDEDDWFG